MADTLGDVDKFLTDLARNVAAVPRQAGRDIGTMGRQEVLHVAVSVFGGDRRFSGARRSRKAKRQATASYRVFDTRVEIYPSGDPFYIFMKGRGGGKKIYPRTKRRHAVLTPGGPRAYSRVGRLTSRTHLLDPAERTIQAKAPRIVSDAIDTAILKAI